MKEGIESMNKEIKIRIDNAKGVKDFVKIIEVNGIKASAVRGSQVRNAGSLVGVLSIDPTKGFNLVLNNEEDYDRVKLLTQAYVIE